MLFNEKLYIKEAPEVTDIIWENLEIDEKVIIRKKIQTILILAAVLCMITALFIYMNQ